MMNLTLADVLRAIRKRPFWILAPLALGVAAAFAAIQLLPPLYRAGTLVMVEKQKVPADYVKATVTTSMEERIRTIEQQVTARDNLANIITELNLYPRELREDGMAPVIERLRRDLAVRKQGDSLFSIYFVSSSPWQAAQVANRVAELFIAQNLKLREDQAEGTSAFLDTELKRKKAELENQEAKIAEFKRTYMGELPGQAETNLGLVEQLQNKLAISMDALDKAEQRKLFVQSQIVQARTAAQAADALRTIPGAAPPRGPSPLDTARAELAALLSQYTERHPEVVRKRAEVARLESLASGAVESEDLSATSAPRREAYVDPGLLAEQHGIGLEIGSLRREQQRILGEIGRVQARLENVPRVEQELIALTRDYDNIQESYKSLLDKQLDSKLYENLEKSRQGEQFRILEKAIPPSHPASPNKPLLLAFGLGAGLLAGFALALLRDQTDSTFTDAESLQTTFPGVPVLATIPLLDEPKPPLRPTRAAVAGG